LLFALIAHDKPNGLAKRQAVRPDHLKHLETLGDRVVMAGPFLDDKGDMTGTFMVIEAESYDDARSAYDRDPYILNGVFDSITIKPWKLTINKTK